MKKFDEKNVEDLWALTPTQEGMLFHYLKNPENNDYFEQLILEIAGKIEVEIFEKAWNFVIRTNEMLRTVFRWRPVKKPVQLVLKVHDFNVNYKETEADIEEPFDLREVPFRVTLCKIEDNRYRMVVTNHHILYDGWSNRIILEEFFAAYQLLSKGEGLKQPVKTPFKEFIKWLQHQDKQQQRNYWQAYLEGFSHGTRLGEITAARYRENERPGKGKRVKSIQTRLPGSLRKLLEQSAAKYKLTPAVIFYTAWGTLLQKCTNCNDVALGTTVSGRNAPIKGIENMVGLFINTVPFRVQDHGGETIKDMLERLQSALQERAKYESTPLVDIRRYSEGDIDNELFDTLVVVENYPLAFDDRLLPGDDMFSIESYNMVEQTHYDLSVGISLFDEIDIRFIYDSSMVSDDMTAALANRFISIINFILEQPGKSIYEIDILSKEEKRQLLIDFNDTAADYPGDKTIHRLFAEQVERTPDNTAVVGANLRVRPHCLTYKELNKKSDQLAVTLQEKGVTPDTIVGIMTERSIDMVIGLLGILKAGAAYLPIDPGYPKERTEYMLSDSSAKILLTDDDLKENLSVTSVSSVAKKHPATRNSQPATRLAYIIYTSGSTGRPKGVMVDHRSAVNYLRWAAGQYVRGERVNFPLFTSISFDLTVTSLYTPLITGNSLIVYGGGDDGHPVDLIGRVFRDGRVGVIKLTPSHLRIAGELTFDSPCYIRRFILGGEELDAKLAADIVKKFGPKIEIYNEYGPTEAAVGCMIYLFDPLRDRDSSVPIGVPAANVRLYILDRHLHLSPLGVPGELFISGAGIARGYLNRPELTAEKFCLRRAGGAHKDHMQSCNHAAMQPCSHEAMELSPHHSLRSSITPLPHHPIYRTGDLARWQPDGNMQFLGRIDDQVKIRGYRIEPGEIEKELLTREDIKSHCSLNRLRRCRGIGRRGA